VFAEIVEPEVPWVWTLLAMLSVPALVALNALFVSIEFALVAVRHTRVEELVKQGVRGAIAAETALRTLDRSIAATQLGITLASIGLGWVGEPTLARLIQPMFGFLGEGKEFAANTLATVLAFMLITFMHVVFGELIPKNVALQTPDRIALWLSTPLLVFRKLTRPLTVLMTITANRVLGRFGYEPADTAEEMVHSVEELGLLIEDTREAGILEPEQALVVQNVFRLSDKFVRDCMVPVDRMATLELNTPPDRVMEIVRRGAHTRLPVYDGDLDNIVGVVNTKDLFYLFSLKGVVILEDAIYPATFLKPDESVATSLRLFKQSRRHMAMVREESGKIVGLLTLEDVLEEIVGDIEDEHDRPTPRVTFRHRGNRPRPSPRK
jgi:putative hemolysin